MAVLNELSAGSISTGDISGTLLTEAQPNITSLGALSSLNVTTDISAAIVNATSLSGTLTTAAQSNIRSIGTLTNLVVTNTISTASVAASMLTGTVMSSYQPNITTVGTLTKLIVSSPVGIGVASPSCVFDIDTSEMSTAAMIRLTNGDTESKISIRVGGLLLSTNKSKVIIGSGANLQMTGGDIIGLERLDVSEISGAIVTPSQPNITKVGALEYFDVSYVGVGSPHSSGFRLNVFESLGRFVTLGTDAASMTVSVLNGDFTINPSTKRLAFWSDVDLVLNGGTIVGLQTLTSTTLTGTLQTPAQSFITSIGELASLTVSGATTLASLTANMLVYGSASIMHSLAIGSTLTIGGTSLSEQRLIELLALENTPSSSDGIVGGTPGEVVPNVALVVGAEKSLGSFSSLTAGSFVGTITTGYQPNITTVGNLTDLNVRGYLGVGTTAPMKQLEINSVTGDCLRLSFNKDYSTARADFSVDANGTLRIAPASGSVQIGSSNSAMPLEVGYSAFTMAAPYSYRTSAGANGVISPVTNPTSYNYSIRACGRILCTRSIDVMSDYRTKKNIKALSNEYCSFFVERTTPVSFNWIHGDPNRAFGYVAQELMRAGFPELVNLVPDESVHEEIDEDGFVSPEGVKYTISYEHIIPILAKNQQRLMRENTELRAKLDAMLSALQQNSIFNVIAGFIENVTP